MKVRVLIIGDDNKVHPNEFPSYVDAINFLEMKRRGSIVPEVEIASVVEPVTVSPSLDGSIPSVTTGSTYDVEESKKKGSSPE